MTLPGELVRSRVVDDPTSLLAALLDRSFSGHVTLDPADALLLDGGGRAVIGFEEGIPVSASHPDSHGGGRSALEALAGGGPFRAELYECSVDVLSDRALGDPIDPAAPADILAVDDALARRTAAAAPDTDAPEPSLDAVESFLADEDAVEALRERAREEATRRAEEWDFPDA